MATPAPDIDRPIAEPSERTPLKHRRSFVFFGALAAATLLPKRLRAQGRSRRRKPIEPAAPVDTGVIEPSEDVAAFAEWDTGGLSRLIRRVTMGMTAGDVRQAEAMGWDGYLNHQLNYQRIDDSVVESAIAAKYPLMAQPSSVLRASSTNVNDVFNQLRESTIYRSAFSQRQLYQRMVEFWSDHFNQDIDKVQTLLVADQRDVIRKYAMSTFPQLLKASAHSASMMVYLDQNVSSSKAPNQNYAREIMELHTLGVDGGYTQNDVAELSRVLTGWTVNNSGDFVFNAALHDTGDKVFLGTTIKGASGAAGQQEGEQVLDMLVNHPSTARFIATKLLRWMVTPSPSDAQVGAIAAVYRATGGDIKAMLRAMLNDSWIPQAPMKLKRPFHFAVSAVRALTPTVFSFSAITTQLNTLGHLIFSWDTPDGFPDKLEYWAGNILPRWQFGTAMSQFNSTVTLAVDLTPYKAGSPANAVDLINQNFFGGEIPSVTSTALLNYAGTATLTDAKTRELIALAISANAFQWY
ncbi:MAG TPA: DUF1800 domain-containing protein [Gemmatimonadaceae bacterium]|nr:DUF1800 domain-containing protein [Gemmatimonadaceae bacterium]